MDSMVLLSLLVRAGIGFSAIHVNHGLSARAQDWEQHCRHWCERFGVPLVIERVVVEPAGEGLEAAARKARYQAFARHLPKQAQLLTAHHRDDQAETVLLRLMRGAGPTGLGAIRARQWMSEGSYWLLRPLLACARQELHEYAVCQSLSWVEDESNSDEALDRNYLRHRVLPALVERWPAAAQKLAQTAALCAANQRLLDQLAQSDGKALTVDQGVGMGWSLPLTDLAALTPERRDNLLRYWLAQWPLVLSSEQLAELWRQLQGAGEDAQLKMTFAGAELRRFNHRLWLLPPQMSAPTEVLRLAPGQRLDYGNGQLTLAPCEKGLALPADGAFQVRCRQGGERSHPQGRKHSQTLKKLLQARGLPPWLRAQVPLLYQGQQLAAVGNLWLEQGAQMASSGWRLVWQLPVNDPPF